VPAGGRSVAGLTSAQQFAIESASNKTRQPEIVLLVLAARFASQPESRTADITRSNVAADPAPRELHPAVGAVRGPIAAATNRPRGEQPSSEI